MPYSTTRPCGITARSGTLFFSFQEFDSTKPAGSVKIRVETIAHYLERYAARDHRAQEGRVATRVPLLRSSSPP